MLERKTLLLIVAAPLALLSIAGIAYLAWRHEPGFYQIALNADAARQAAASHQLIEQASALVNDIQRQGNWQSLVTADQVNGWLAVDLPKNHAQLLPPEISQPRVSLEDGRIHLACRRGEGSLATVLTLEIEPYLLQTNELAIRIRSARAGWLPLPLAPLLNQVTQAAIEADVALRWDQAGGDPVAVFTLSARRNDHKVLAVETLEVHVGELYIAGTTRSSDWPSAEPSPERDQPAAPVLEARLPDPAVVDPQ